MYHELKVFVRNLFIIRFLSVRNPGLRDNNVTKEFLIKSAGFAGAKAINSMFTFLIYLI